MILAAITAFSFLLPATLHAKPKPVEHHTTIEAVSATSITVNAPDGVKTYKIGPHTEIMFDGQDTTIDQLHPGMRVQVTPDPVDEDTVSVIQADNPSHDPAPRPEVTPMGTPFKFGN